MPDRRLVAIDVAVKVATIVLLAWAVLNPDLPQFTGKAFTGRALAYPIALLVAAGRLVAARPTARPRVPGRRRHPARAPVPRSTSLGNALDLYDSIEWWDDVNHLVNWALHTAADRACCLTGRDRGGRGRDAALAFGWAAERRAVLWELAEYVAFVPDSPEAATAYADTPGRPGRWA